MKERGTGCLCAAVAGTGVGEACVVTGADCAKAEVMAVPYVVELVDALAIDAPLALIITPACDPA
jgi:hypothetical protein